MLSQEPLDVGMRRLTDRRVLMINRDEASVRTLRDALLDAGFSVLVHCGALASTAVERTSPHLILLNWDLPAVTIQILLKQLRRMDPDERPNLLALSESCAEEQVLKGFELGVDDFVVKPYSEPEVIARVRAILRARLPRPEKTNILEFHDLRLHPKAALVTAREEPVQLRALEFRLLRFLLQHPHRAFSREQLLDRIWGPDHRSDTRAVDATVQRARKALLPHGCGEYLQAVRGVGYRLSIPPGRRPDS